MRNPNEKLISMIVVLLLLLGLLGIHVINSNNARQHQKTLHQKPMTFICENMDGRVYYDNNTKIMYLKDKMTGNYELIRDDFGNVETYKKGRYYE